jgi:Carbohydrate family 9 binding domain-like
MYRRQRSVAGPEMHCVGLVPLFKAIGLSLFAGEVVFALSMTSIVHTNHSNVATMKSVRAAHDVALNLDPGSPFWRNALPVSFAGDNYGRAVPQLLTEARSRWTDDSLYLLFVCPYQKLNLKPSPETKAETNRLWNWDVAEAFIGSDFGQIGRYKEFELSPQGEWLDLDIDLGRPHHEDGWTWNSGFETAASVDSERKIWYGAMRIPFASIGSQQPHIGSVFRVNFFRSQGAPPDRQLLAWQAPMSESFHVPERFGRLELVK